TVHRVRGDLIQAGPDACDESFVYGLCTVDAESEVFEKIDDRIEIPRTDVVSAEPAVDVQVLEHEHCKPFLKLPLQNVFDGSVLVSDDFSGEPVFQFAGTEAGIEIYRHAYFFSLL